MGPAHADQRARDPVAACRCVSRSHPLNLSIRGDRRGHDPTTQQLALTPLRANLARGRSAADVVLLSDMTSPYDPWTLLHHQRSTGEVVILLLSESRRRRTTFPESARRSRVQALIRVGLASSHAGGVRRCLAVSPITHVT
jgi:hypothetical protein